MTSGTLLGHKRPLPPPSIHERVLEQSYTVESWTELDAEGGIFMENCGKRPKVSHDICDNHPLDAACQMPDHQETHRPNEFLTNENVLPQVAVQHRLGLEQKKRSLFTSEQARTAARAFLGCAAENLHPNVDPVSCPRALKTDNRAANVDGERLTNEVLEAQMLLELTSYKGTCPQQTSFEQDGLEDELDAIRRKEEELGRERSRALREQVLAARTETALNHSIINPTVDSRFTEKRLNTVAHGDARKQATLRSGITASDALHIQYDGHINSEQSGCSEKTALPTSTESNLVTCQAHVQQMSPSYARNETRDNSLNPPSRIAAEQYHDEHQYVNANRPDSRSRTNHDANAARLRELTMLHQQRTPLRPKARILDQDTVSTDFNGQPKHDQRLLGVSKNLNSFTGARHGRPSTPGEGYDRFSNNNHDSSPLVSSHAEKPRSLQTELRQNISTSNTLSPLAVLELQDRVRESQNSVQDVTPKLSNTPAHPSQSLRSLFISYSSQDDMRYVLTLPSTFHEMKLELQDAIICHESLKERKRDLQAISKASQYLARLANVQSLDKKERKWVSEMQQFASKVIDEGLCGRPARDGLQQITSVVRKRLLRHPRENESVALSLTKRLLGNKFESLQQEIATVNSKLEMAGQQRQQIKAQKHNPSKVAATRNQNSNQIGCVSSSANGTEELTATQNRQSAQYAVQDRRLRLLKENLSAFREISTQDDVGLTGVSQATSIDESDSDISEEDDGEEFYAGAGISRSQISNQKPDEDLLRQNQKRKKLQNTMQRQSEQVNVGLSSRDLETTDLEHEVAAPIEQEDIAVEQEQIEHGFDDLDQDAPSEQTDPFCYRYVVSMTMRGFNGYKDGEEYHMGNHVDIQHANRRADELESTIIDQHQYSIEYHNDKVIQQSGGTTEDGTKDLYIELGRDGNASCRIRVIKEQYTPTRAELDHVRIKAACIAKPVFWVLWRKTISRPESTNDDIQSIQAAQNVARNREISTKPASTKDIALDTTGLREHGQSSLTEGKPAIHAGNERGSSPDILLEDLFGSMTPPPTIRNAQLPPSLDVSQVQTYMQNPKTSQWHPSEISTCTSPLHLPLTPPPTNSVSSTATKSSPVQSDLDDMHQDSITEIHFNEIQHYSSIALANQYAKSVFMNWFTHHLAGPSNEVIIRHEDSQLEDELQSHGDTVTWDHEEEVEIKGRNGSTAVEKFKVWVETKSVKGPGN